MYWTIRLWLRALAADGRIALDLVPNGDLDALRAVLRPGQTKVVWVETPANPTCAITDIAAVAEIAHAAGAQVVADGTVATPVLSRPLEFGAESGHALGDQAAERALGCPRGCARDGA